MSYTLSELQDLALTRPAVDAPAPIVAEWYRRKATVLEHLAYEGTPAAAEHARIARDHARKLDTPVIPDIVTTGVRKSDVALAGVSV